MITNEGAIRERYYNDWAGFGEERLSGPRSRWGGRGGGAAIAKREGIVDGGHPDSALTTVLSILPH
jgi:hypothetical protein